MSLTIIGRQTRRLDPRAGCGVVLAGREAEGTDLGRASMALQLGRDTAIVFGDHEGRHRHPERFSRLFAQTLSRCARDLGDDAPPVIRLHDLRHTHATILLGSGVNVKVV